MAAIIFFAGIVAVTILIKLVDNNDIFGSVKSQKIDGNKVYVNGKLVHTIIGDTKSVVVSNGKVIINGKRVYPE